MKNCCLFLLFVIVGLSSCVPSKSIRNTTKNSVTKADKVVLNALAYQGVRYRYGGTTSKGMDCSGIVYIAYLQENVKLPRVSRNMAKRGREISLRNATKGDLIFFKTSKKGRGINHVGMIVSNKKGHVRFIHSTTSKGVITSSLSNKYWKRAFVKVNRIL